MNSFFSIGKASPVAQRHLGLLSKLTLIVFCITSLFSTFVLTSSADDLLYSGVRTATEKYFIEPNRQIRIGAEFRVGEYKLRMQEDGNLVFSNFSGSKIFWRSYTSGIAVQYAMLKSNGSLIIHPAKGEDILISPSQLGITSKLYIDSKGQLKIYIKKTAWSSNQYLSSRGTSSVYKQQLTKLTRDPYKEKVFLIAGNYGAYLNKDGNFYVRRKDAEPGEGLIWQTSTAGKSINYLTLQPDGNFLLRLFDNNAAWETGTSYYTAPPSPLKHEVRLYSNGLLRVQTWVTETLKN